MNHYSIISHMYLKYKIANNLWKNIKYNKYNKITLLSYSLRTRKDEILYSRKDQMSLSTLDTLAALAQNIIIA